MSYYLRFKTLNIIKKLEHLTRKLNCRRAKTCDNASKSPLAQQPSQHVPHTRQSSLNTISVGDTAVYKVQIHARAMQLAVRRLLWDQAPGTIFIVTMTGGIQDAQLH